MKNRPQGKLAKKTFTYDEFRKVFLPSSAEKPKLKSSTPADLGAYLAKQALLELEEALQVSRVH